MKKLYFTCAMLCLSLAAISQARAEIVAIEAFDNATVQPGGPRSGGGGKAFFNIEGTDNGNFASYGVADFDFSALGAADFISVDSLTISLVQSNAGFTTDGPVNFYLASDFGTSIQPGEGLFFDDTLPDGEGVGSQLGTLLSLGSGNFAQTASGDVDEYQFALSGAAADTVLDQFNTLGRFRLVITPGDAAVAATWAGFSNADFAGPTLSLSGATAIPEPASVAFLAGCSLLVGGTKFRRGLRASKRA